jgi:hypothetical protein
MLSQLEFGVTDISCKEPKEKSNIGFPGVTERPFLTSGDTQRMDETCTPTWKCNASPM